MISKSGEILELLKKNSDDVYLLKVTKRLFYFDSKLLFHSSDEFKKVIYLFSFGKKKLILIEIIKNRF